ncbi:MAG: tail fiber protein [Aeriscardovia sp.]|nr:tail fiber protein [Aeriscardovia sp.]
MATKDYNFQYVPLTGRLPGNSFVKQTEQAINELAGIVNEGSAQVEVITNLANTANANSEEALEKANEALETSGRVYITLPNLSDADDYYDSQLYYFANSYSHNLPVQRTGFLEVKTNDTKTACEQVFIADLTGSCYFRHGTITSAEVGSETVYSVTWDIWSSALASEDYVQQEVNTGISAANDYTDEQVVAAKDYTDNKVSIGVPTGCVQAFAGSTTPAGWLLCDGSAVSRTTYAKLFAVIGTTYGTGDGSTTFNLPNLVDKFIEGSSTAGTVKSAGLPNIEGFFGGVNTAGFYGAFDGDGEVRAGAIGEGFGIWKVNFNASASNSIYGNSSTVQPPALTMRYIIKY